MACIIIASGSQRGLFLTIARKTLVIGRDEGLLLQLHDEHVSRKHLKIRYDDSRQTYYAIDLESANGTIHNGHRLTEETPLFAGDELILGDTHLLFTDEIPEDQPNALEVLKKAGQRYRRTALE